MNTLNIENLSKYLNTNKNVLFAYLFGSYANGSQNDKSDVDIALFLDNVSLDEQLQINYELSKLLKKDVDLVILNSVKNIYLLEDILLHSKVIKDDQNRFDFELKKQHEILDFKAFRKVMDAA